LNRASSSEGGKVDPDQLSLSILAGLQLGGLQLKALKDALRNKGSAIEVTHYHMPVLMSWNMMICWFFVLCGLLKDAIKDFHATHDSEKLKTKLIEIIEASSPIPSPPVKMEVSQSSKARKKP